MHSVRSRGDMGNDVVRRSAVIYVSRKSPRNATLDWFDSHIKSDIGNYILKSMHRALDAHCADVPSKARLYIASWPQGLSRPNKTLDQIIGAALDDYDARRAISPRAHTCRSSRTVREGCVRFGDVDTAYWVSNTLRARMSLHMRHIITHPVHVGVCAQVWPWLLIADVCDACGFLLR